MKKSLLLQGIVWFFALLFLYTGVVKLMELPLFREQVISSPLIGWMAGFITWGLPIAELLLAVALCIPIFRVKALYATLSLMICFTIYVAVVLVMDNHLSCSCGGIIEELTPREHILFNIACIFLSAIAVGLTKGHTLSLRTRRLAGVSAICLLAFIGWTLFTVFSAPARPKSGMEGRLLPSFSLLMPDSVTYLNTGDIPTGKPFIVIGFQPWCIHCQAETRDIIQHIHEFGDIAIYYVTPYPFLEMKTFYKHFKLANYSNIKMGRDSRDFFLSYFKAPTVPYTAIFDSQKRLKQVFNTQTDAKRLVQAVND